jgi:hypothetical protein
LVVTPLASVRRDELAVVELPLRLAIIGEHWLDGRLGLGQAWIGQRPATPAKPELWAGPSPLKPCATKLRCQRYRESRAAVS